MTAEIVEGTKVGRYSLLTRLASGGMANVWLARVDGVGGFQKTVVVKTILPHLAGDPDFVRMFIDEALVASRIQHPNVVNIFDLGESGGSHFIAMEYIPGRTLRHLQRELKRTRRVPPPWLLLRVMASACDALHYAHSMVDDDGAPMHIVHRDVSPENIMVSFTGDTKVLDFGIAKASNAVSKTQAGVLKGKHAYMAPEQIEGAMDGMSPDPRMDVYSAGVVLYELISGRRPFRAPNEIALLRLILDTEAAPPHTFCAWVPEPLSDLVMKAMARDPDKRFQSAMDLRDAIESYFQSTGSFPTRGHVANYLHGLFGDVAMEPPVSHPTPSSGPPRRDSQVVDPWETTGDLASPVTIDLSMVLCSDDESPDSQPMSSLSPHGVSRPAAPPPPLEPAVPGQELRAEDKLPEVDQGWSIPSVADGSIEDIELPRPTTGGAKNRMKSSAPPVPPTLRPSAPDQPGADESTGVRLASSRPPNKQQAQSEPAPENSAQDTSKSHLWDRLTQRAREEKQTAAASNDDVGSRTEEGNEAAETTTGRHAWDVAVGRIRGSVSPGADEGGEAPAERPKRASDWFDDGLTCWRNKDLDGTLLCWTKALEMDPENRRYESNVRKLKKQLSERGSEG